MWQLLVVGAVLISYLEARRVSVRPSEDDEEPTIHYYSAAEPQEGTEQRVVLVSAADQYNGLYGQPSAAPRLAQDNYIQQYRGAQPKAPRAKESPKQPPVQTIRNYNKVNDDGSFTFGYEAADGSFKEETRGTDCVVRGKYGYVDPDGNKREFTYVSGNPCDPNAPKEEELEKEEESNEPENIPPNYPTKPIRPLKPILSSTPKPAVTLFQNAYAAEEEVQPEPEQLLKPTPPQLFFQQPARLRPQYITRPQFLQSPAQEESQPVYQQQRLVAATTPASVIYKQSLTPVNITPRPPTTETPATTYRPQLLQVAVTPRPSLFYTKQISANPRPAFLGSTPSPLFTRGNLDFDAEFQKFQQENNVVSPTPSPALSKATPRVVKPAPAPGAPGNGPIYSSELVFDPASGQYNTQLYQTLPQTQGDFTLNHRIQPYVQAPNSIVNLQQLQQRSPLYNGYRTISPQASQAVYQQQLIQKSANLFEAQQKAQHQQQHQSPVRPQPDGTPQQQQYYYIQPTSFQQPQGLVGGQIDAFLRGHNIQF